MFQAPKLTDAGKNLYYRNMAGEGIKFTTIQLGNGTISGPISAMTALVSAVVTIDAAVKNNAEQYADVSGHFSNAELEEGFYWREIGVFAADPDYPNDRSHDILYCYQNAYDTADFIPVASVETVISIHALREEGDVSRSSRNCIGKYFYPRPPRGGRPTELLFTAAAEEISIHALREEGDRRLICWLCL